MSLVLLFRDEMIADRRCVLAAPHAMGQIYNTKKLRVSADKTFAFGAVGPTLSEAELNVLEAIIKHSFKDAKGDDEIVPLAHQAWFKGRSTMSMMVMTKLGSYFLWLSIDLFRRSGFQRDMNNIKMHSLVRYSPDYPAGSGTGMQAASIAAREGVPMKQVMEMTSRVVYSVGPECDYIHRKSLKGFKL